MFNILNTRKFLNLDNFRIFKFIGIELFLFQLRQYSYRIYDNHSIILSITLIIDKRIFQDLSIPYENYWIYGLHFLSPILIIPEEVNQCPICNNSIEFLGIGMYKNTKCIRCNQLISSYKPH